MNNRKEKVIGGIIWTLAWAGFWIAIFMKL